MQVAILLNAIGVEGLEVYNTFQWAEGQEKNVKSVLGKSNFPNTVKSVLGKFDAHCDLPVPPPPPKHQI